MILYFRNKMGAKPVFSKGELNMILSLYGERVKRGEWHDYAIDSLPDMAVFSVFRGTHASPVYAIAKIPARSILKSVQFAVYEGEKTLKQGDNLREVLAVFGEEA